MHSVLRCETVLHLKIWFWHWLVTKLIYLTREKSQRKWVRQRQQAVVNVQSQLISYLHKPRGVIVLWKSVLKTGYNVTELFEKVLNLRCQKAPQEEPPDLLEIKRVLETATSKKELPRRIKPLQLPDNWHISSECRKLVMARQLLDSVPPWVFATNIVVLDLSENKLLALPDVLTSATSLKKLLLQKNLFTEIPQSLMHLTSLEVPPLFVVC